MKWKDIKIGTQLKVSLGFVFMLMFVLGIISWWQTYRLVEETRNLYEYPFRLRKAVDDLKLEITSMRLEHRNYLLADNEVSRQKALAKTEASEANINRLLNILKERYQGDPAALESLRVSISDWKSLRETNRTIQTKDDIQAALSRVDDKGDIGITRAKMLRHLKTIDDYTLRSGREKLIRSYEIQKSYYIRLLLLLTISIGLTILISYLLYRNIKRPLKILLDSVNRFKNNESGVHCNYEANNEFGELSESFNTLFLKVVNELENREALVRERTKDLLIAKEKAEESDKLKSAFLMNVSHEIRTPMNGIIGFLNLLSEPNLDEQSKLEYIEIVNKSADRLLYTINDIIELSRIESGLVEIRHDEILLTDVMECQLESFLPQTQEKGLSFRVSTQVEGLDSIIVTDRNKLEVVLTNLIKNAIKFTSKGEVEFGNFVEEEMLVFYVKDSGKGIPADRLGIIFERFIQIDDRLTRIHEGSGLGLPIAKAYVEAMGGEITVQSEMDKGSEFRFWIPYHKVL